MRGTRPNWLGLTVVVGLNYGTEQLFLQNSDKPVRGQSYDPAVKLGKTDIDRIIGIRMERLFGQGKLRVRIVYFKLSRRRVGLGRDPGFDKPQTKVLENLRDDFLIFYEADDAHRSVALGPGERVDFLDFLNWPRPQFFNT